MLGIHTYRSDMFAPGMIFEQNVNDTKVFDRLILGDWNTVEYGIKRFRKVKKLGSNVLFGMKGVGQSGVMM